jgi:protein O-mannosyl-transferase
MDAIPSPRDSERTRSRVDWQTLAIGAVLAISVIVAYGRTLSVPLLFDDNPSIENNPTIRHLGNAFLPPPGSTVSGRPILNLSLAIDYAISGTAVWSYHATNLAIHILAGLTLMGVLRRTLGSRTSVSALAIAFSIALLWALHPLQTEAVTYISQRAESLMGLFYLLTVYCFIRGISPDARFQHLWFVLCCVSCLLGMATKEVMVSVPLIVLVYDRTFVAGCFREAIRRRWPVYSALSATWIILLLLVYYNSSRSEIPTSGSSIVWWRYALTQLPAVSHYIRLCFWPYPLIFDYGTTLVAPSIAILPYGLFILGLASATVWALAKRPAAGFLGIAFFAILAPSSSVVPVVGETMADYRMYLPSISVVILVVLGIYRLPRRVAFPLCLILAAVLFGATLERNEVYRSYESVWRDTVARRADNERAHNNLGIAFLNDAGRLDDAIAEFRESLRLNGEYVEARNNLGFALEMAPGRLNDAVAQFEEVIRQKPDYADAHYNLGNTLDSLGRTTEAIAQYREALRLRPDFVAAHCNLGLSLSTLGRAQDAIAEYNQALRIKPDDANVLYDLAFELMRIPGRTDEAVVLLRRVLKLQPANAAAREALARIDVLMK